MCRRGQPTGGGTTLYSNNQKGDTVLITNYKQNGNFITEVNHDKDNLPYTATNLYDDTKLVESVSIGKECILIARRLASMITRETKLRTFHTNKL